MTESIFEDLDQNLRQKAMLTVSDIAKILDCPEVVVYNWNKRPEKDRRPPSLRVGKELRFPKREFFRWLAKENGWV